MARHVVKTNPCAQIKAKAVIGGNKIAALEKGENFNVVPLRRVANE